MFGNMALRGITWT